MSYGFTELVKQQFHFLTQYGFSVVNEGKNFQVFGDRLVEFRSETTVVIVTDDRGSVTVDVGPVSEPKIAWHDIINIISFMAPDEKVSSYIKPPELARQPEKRIRYQVEKYSSLLRKYCGPFLKGDFSDWIELEQSIIERSRVHHKALTGKDLPETALEEYVKAKINKLTPPNA